MKNITSDKVIQRHISKLYPLAGDIDIQVSRNNYSGLTSNGTQLIKGTKLLCSRIKEILTTALITVSISQVDINIDTIIDYNNLISITTNN